MTHLLEVFSETFSLESRSIPTREDDECCKLSSKKEAIASFCQQDALMFVEKVAGGELPLL